MFTSETYKKRREKLVQTFKDNSLYIVCSGENIDSTDDECYIFEPYRNFYYLTGLQQPDAKLLISKINGKVNQILFMHYPTEMEQRWNGTKFDANEVKELSGVDRISPEDGFESMISRLIFRNDIQDIYVDIARMDMNYHLNKSQTFANKLKEIYPFITFHNAYQTVCTMRTVKDSDEIEAHRKAVNITEEGVKNILKNMKPGMTESQIEAYYDFVLKGYNIKKPAFTTIAATGKNACIMHYTDNDTVTKENDLILFDLGAQWQHYCADVSRTYPVSGKFTERQKQLYNVVLKGLEAAEEMSKPGQLKSELQLISKKVMAQELVKIGKIKEEKEIDKYYFHGSGHLIGLNTHDVGDRDDMILEENVMFTLEPGLYFDDEEIGIRIEDTLLVTKDGCEILSAGIPKTVEEIEAFMSK